MTFTSPQAFRYDCCGYYGCWRCRSVTSISVPLPFDHSTDETLSGVSVVCLVSASSLGGRLKAVESCGYRQSCGGRRSCGTKGARVPFCQSSYPSAGLWTTARSRSLPSLLRLSPFLCCCSSCIRRTFRVSSPGRTAIRLAFSIAIILNSTALSNW